MLPRRIPSPAIRIRTRVFKDVYYFLFLQGMVGWGVSVATCSHELRSIMNQQSSQFVLYFSMQGSVHKVFRNSENDIILTTFTCNSGGTESVAAGDTANTARVCTRSPACVCARVRQGVSEARTPSLCRNVSNVHQNFFMEWHPFFF